MKEGRIKIIRYACDNKETELNSKTTSLDLPSI